MSRSREVKTNCSGSSPSLSGKQTTGSSKSAKSPKLKLVRATDKAKGPTSTFKIKIQYFKNNGKFYTEAEFDFQQKRGAKSSCYMPDVVSHIVGLRDKGGAGALPGLCDFTEGWPGYIIVNCDDGYPHLILAPKDPW